MLSRRTAAEISVYAVLCAPLIVSDLFLFSYNTARLVWLFAAVALCGFFVFRSCTENASPPLRLNVIDLVWGAFLLTITLSLLVAPDVSQGLWGGAARNTGVILYWCAGFWYASMRCMSWTDREWGRISAVAVGVAVIGSLWTIVDYVLISASADSFNVRASGPAGNAMHMGNYLAPYLFLVVFLCIRRVQFQQPRHRWPYLVAALLILLAIGVTFTRSAYLGVILGVSVLGVNFLLDRFHAHRRYLFAAAIGLLLVLGSVTYLGVRVGKGIHYTAQGSAWQRFIISTDSIATLRTRVLNWGLGAQGFLERPLLGWGWENYRTPADKYFDPAIAQFSFYETRIDKPHNFFIEVLVTTGAFGFVVYVALFVVLVWSIYRLKSAGNVGALDARALYGSVIAYAIGLLFGFDTPQTVFYFALLLAFVASQRDSGMIKIQMGDRVRRVVWICGIFFFGITTLYIATSWVRPAYFITRGLTASANNDFNGVDTAFRRAIAGPHGPHFFETWRWFAQALLYPYAADTRSLADLTPQERRRWDEDVAQIAAFGDQYTAAHPDSSDWQTFGGKVAYHIAIAKNDPASLGVAERLFLRAYEISPNRQEAPVLLTYIYAAKNDSANTTLWLNRALRLSGSKEIVTLIDFLIQPRLRGGDLNGVITLLEQTIAVRPMAEIYGKLAAAYAAVGRYDDARAAVARAIELDPLFAIEAQQFLKTLPPASKK